MLLFLVQGIKTAIERSDVFHVWNSVCDNFFKYLCERKQRVESKLFIQDMLEGDRNILSFSPPSLQWISSQNFCEHKRAMFS